MTEDILDMDRDRKVDARPVDIEALLRRIEVLEKQEHTCDCPNRIVDMGKEMRRLDFLDENDEKLRQGINESHRDLEIKLEEEHRLRVMSEEEVRRIADECDGTLKALADVKEENKKFANQNLRLGVIAGVCAGVCIVVLALGMAGLI